MTKKLLLLAIVAPMLFAIAACGWHLRGEAVSGLSIDGLYLDTSHSHDDLLQLLRKRLLASGVALVEEATQAQYRLIIIAENSDRRAATFSASTRISELLLTETAIFEVVDKQGSSVIPPTEVVVERVLEYDEDNVFATDDESFLLKQEMRRELARKIQNRIRYFKKPVVAGDAPAS
jgi:LPS-assembly lipoprotein